MHFCKNSILGQNNFVLKYKKTGQRFLLKEEKKKNIQDMIWL